MRMLAARGPAALPLPAPVCCAGKPCCLPACHNPPVPLRPAVPRIHAISKLLREDDETPMTMFFGFMGLLIFLSVGPLLLILWCACCACLLRHSRGSLRRMLPTARRRLPTHCHLARASPLSGWRAWSWAR